MITYFDASLDWDQFKIQGIGLAENAARFDAKKARTRLIHDEGFKPEQIVPYYVRPFDFQFCYYSGIRPLWNEPRPQLWDWSRIAGNQYLASRQMRGGEPEGPPFYFLSCIGDDHALRTDAYFFPMRFHDDKGGLFGKSEVTNLSIQARLYLNGLGFTNIDDDPAIYSSPWWHALAIGFSPRYLEEHREGIAIGWPRVPMPKHRPTFDNSAALGKRLARLLNPTDSVAGVTSGAIAEVYKVLGVLSAVDLTVRAGWGHKDTQGRVNPGKGRTMERHYTAAETDAIRKGTVSLSIDESRAFELLGPGQTFISTPQRVGVVCRKPFGSISLVGIRSSKSGFPTAKTAS